MGRRGTGRKSGEGCNGYCQHVKGDDESCGMENICMARYRPKVGPLSLIFQSSNGVRLNLPALSSSIIRPRSWRYFLLQVALNLSSPAQRLVRYTHREYLEREYTVCVILFIRNGSNCSHPNASDTPGKPAHCSPQTYTTQRPPPSPTPHLPILLTAYLRYRSTDKVKHRALCLHCHSPCSGRCRLLLSQ